MTGNFTKLDREKMYNTITIGFSLQHYFRRLYTVRVLT